VFSRGLKIIFIKQIQDIQLVKLISIFESMKAMNLNEINENENKIKINVEQSVITRNRKTWTICSGIIAMFMTNEF
jgi:hypothetical protein